MLDIRFVRENTQLVEEKAKQKGFEANLSNLLELDEKHRRTLAEKERVQAERNQLDHKYGQHPTPEKLKVGKRLKEELARIESELKPVEKEYKTLLGAVPNVFRDDTPLGGEEANREERKWGGTPEK